MISEKKNNKRITKEILNKRDNQWTDYYERRIDYFDGTEIGKIKYYFKKYQKIENVMRYMDKITLLIAYETLYKIESIGKEHEDNNPDTICETRAIDKSIFKKATGTDNIDINEYGEKLEDNINELVYKLKNNKYKTKQIKRCYIPKDETKDANGNIITKYRPLSIACTEDVILQIAMLYQVLVPITEEIFVNESFAYRPKRSVKDAIRYLEEINRKEDIKWLLALDIEAFFDNIQQDKLIEMLKEIIADKRFIKIIKIILETEYYDMKDKKVYKPNKGIYQGINIAPILANLYLHNVIDIWYKEINTKDNIYMIRYADDVMILTKNYEDAIKAKEEINQRFNSYGLKLSEEKTEIINFEKETIAYLGYLIEKKDNKIYKYISEKTINRYKKKANLIIGYSIEDRNRGIDDIDKEKWRRKHIRDLNNRLMGIYKCYCEVDNFNSLYTIYNYTIEQIKERWSKYEELKYYIDQAVELVLSPEYVILYNLRTEKRR